MVSIYLLKSKFQILLRPISDGFAHSGISANMITVAAFVLSCIIGAVIWGFTADNRLWYLILPLALFLRMALNAIDGMIAREHNQQTELGAILNELCDMLSDCVIYIPFLLVLSEDWLLTAVFSLFAVISEAVGLMGVLIGASRRYDGPMGKSDRAFWLGLVALVSSYYPIPHKMICVTIIIFCLLLICTVINRITGALYEVKK